MKVWEAPEEFTSILVKLETEEEAELLWHLLNRVFDSYIVDLVNDRRIMYSPSPSLKTRMWALFGAVFTPKYKRGDI